MSNDDPGDPSNNVGRQPAPTNCCPKCSGSDISPHPESFGMFQCSCGESLVRLKREGAFGDNFIYRSHRGCVVIASSNT